MSNDYDFYRIAADESFFFNLENKINSSTYWKETGLEPTTN